jgi:hypothetical protein
MIKSSVYLNGAVMTEGSDFKFVKGELSFDFTIQGSTKNDSTDRRTDIVRVETFDEGVLTQRDTYLAAPTAQGERFRWHQRTTEKFRDQDL